MSEPLSPQISGIFDRSSKGQHTTPVDVEVERGRISFFAETIGATNPIHHSVKSAQDAGYPAIVAPPTFGCVVDMLAAQKLSRLGEHSIVDIIRCDFRKALHGDERYTYTSPILADETVRVSTTVVDFKDKRDGLMELAILRTEISSPLRGLLVCIHRTLIHRL